MQDIGKKTLTVIAGLTLALGSQAQTVFRCGNMYSQTPCPDGTQLNLNDRREPDQKKQTEVAADQTARLARSMEQSRVAEEKRLLAGQRADQFIPSEKGPAVNGSTSQGAVLTSKRTQPKLKKSKP